jgi:hypothetical protein
MAVPPKEGQMKKLIQLLFLIAIAIGPAYGTQPAQAADPSGFHSSAPLILNITASKDNFSCEAQKDSLGNPVYRNDVFVPLNGNNIKILLQSVPGKREGVMPSLQVIDPCTASIDGSPAIVQIPKNAHGYRVYANPMGQQTPIPGMQVTPQLIVTKDEGTTLVYLGKLTPTGFETPYSSFSRTKGQWTPEDITPLFEWSGNICSPTCTSGACTSTLMCCTPPGLPAPPAPGGIPVPPAPGFGSCSPKTDVCPAGTLVVPFFCQTVADEWLLNIANFATYLSGPNTNVEKLEIRFYPEK